MASRNSQQHDQTATRIVPSRKKSPNAEPRDDYESDHPQRDDTLEKGFLQSRKAWIIQVVELDFYTLRESKWDIEIPDISVIHVFRESAREHLLR